MPTMSPVIDTVPRTLDRPECRKASDFECIERLAFLVKRNETEDLGEVASLINQLTIELTRGSQY
jgi:hypothetical protein